MAHDYSAVIAPYVSGRRSRKNCQVLRTSRIMSKSMSATTMSSSVRFVDLGDELAARVAEVALAVELADPPRLFPAGPVDRADEVLVRHGVGRLLELPQILAQAGDRRRRVEHDLRAVQAQAAGAIREVAVVANVNADLADLRVEHRVAQVAGPEIKLLPEARVAVRDVNLAELAEVLAVASITAAVL